LKRFEETYFAHLVVVLDKCVYNLNCKEIIVDRGFGVCKENVGGNDSSEVMCVHLRTRLLVDLVEGSYPIEESAQDFETVSVRLG